MRIILMDAGAGAGAGAGGRKKQDSDPDSMELPLSEIKKWILPKHLSFGRTPYH